LWLPSREAMDLVAGMWQLIARSFVAVPDELWWDNQAGIGRRGRLTDPVTALVGTLGSRVVQLKPYGPKSQGGRGAAETVSGNLVSARPHLHLPVGFQCSTGSMASDRQRPPGAGP